MYVLSDGADRCSADVDVDFDHVGRVTQSRAEDGRYRSSHILSKTKVRLRSLHGGAARFGQQYRLFDKDADRQAAELVAGLKYRDGCDLFGPASSLPQRRGHGAQLPVSYGGRFGRCGSPLAGWVTRNLDTASKMTTSETRNELRTLSVDRSGPPSLVYYVKCLPVLR